MSFFRNHIALIVPLAVFLFSYQFYVSVDRMVVDYEENINKSYSIIIASEKKLTLEEVGQRISSAESLESISPDKILKDIKEDVSAANLALLKVSLPRFYSLKLERFPKEAELEVIKKELQELAGIKQIETFAKSHNQIYRLLLFIKTISTIFAAAIFAVSFLLMVKQIEVWSFEHLQRMEIMSLFGAPYWMRSAYLIRLAIVDSIVSSLLVAYTYYLFGQNSELETLITELGLSSIPFEPLSDGIVLALISLAISLVSVFTVIGKQKDVA